jgi:hypothetical protein
MKQKPHIIVVHVKDDHDARTKLESIENTIVDKDQLDELFDHEYAIFTLSEFMDEWNNDDLTHEDLDNTFIGYVNLLKN